MIPALANLQPEPVWKHFDRLAAIPRASTKEVYSSSRLVTLFIPFLEMSSGAGTAAELSSREPGEDGRCCRFFPTGGVRD